MKQVILLLAMMLLPMAADAETVEIDGIYYELISKAKEAIVKQNPSGKYTGNVVIPASVTYDETAYSVTSIGSRAFEGCSGLTSVTIPNSVTNIGRDVFYGCNGLTSVKISNSMTSIGVYVFYGCSSLTTITIPNSVAIIGGYAFEGCSSLTSVTIGCGIDSIGNGTFSKCPELTDVYCLSEKVPSTGSGIFKDSYIEYATLHVPDASIDNYKATAPWKNFKNIVALNGEDSTQKCATPTIAFVDGELVFSCETEGVEYVSEVSSKDTKIYYDSRVKLGGTYIVSVYAMKTGWENSDVATLEFSLGSGGVPCDVNGDGKVDVSDYIGVANYILTGSIYGK